MDAIVKSFARNALRRASYKWKPRNVVFKAARIARNQYVCNICKKIFGRKEVELDHVIPCVPMEGWVSFDSFIERLFVQESGYQVICSVCHLEKSLKEGVKRRKKKMKGKKKNAKTKMV